MQYNMYMLMLVFQLKIRENVTLKNLVRLYSNATQDPTYYASSFHVNLILRKNSRKYE